MKMRHLLVPFALLAAGSAVAADLANLHGQTCRTDSGRWHFVNNQIPGAPAGTLTALWSSGDYCVVGPSKINLSVQHFNCIASGELLAASTTLGGRLVLSDYTCTDKCDPKVEKCE